MSSMASAWAMDLPGLGPHERLVLLLVAECHDPSTHIVDCDMDWVREKSGLENDDARKAVSGLMERGLMGESFQLNIRQPRAVI